LNCAPSRFRKRRSIRTGSGTSPATPSFYTHFYLHPDEASFHPRAKHRQDSQFVGPHPWAPEEKLKIGEPYSKAEVREYHELCRAEVETSVPALNLDSPSGFHWLPFNEAELQFYNIRHLQHHAGQLADRLRTVANAGAAWMGSRD
jgi:hypothetical protein